MPAKIDTPGVYRGPVKELGLTLTKENKYPMAVLRFLAAEKYVETPEEMEHFEIGEPGWIDWSSYNEESTGFFVLFKANIEDGDDCIPGENSFLSYEQLQLALGWEGADFGELNDDTFEGKEVLFRVEESTDPGFEGVRVQWIDAYDAPPQRELRKLDEEKVSALNKLLKGVKKSAPKAAAAATKPGKPGKPKAAPKEEANADGADDTNSFEADVESDAGTAAESSQTPPAPKPPSTSKAKPKQDKSGVPGELSQGDAWALVITNKGDNSDDDIAEAWISAAGEVGPDKDEADYTDADWAEVARIVVRDLALTIDG